jgi:hypothetical protein
MSICISMLYGLYLYHTAGLSVAFYCMSRVPPQFPNAAIWWFGRRKEQSARDIRVPTIHKMSTPSASPKDFQFVDKDCWLIRGQFLIQTKPFWRFRIIEERLTSTFEVLTLEAGQTLTFTIHTNYLHILVALDILHRKHVALVALGQNLSARSAHYLQCIRDAFENEIKGLQKADFIDSAWRSRALQEWATREAESFGHSSRDRDMYKAKCTDRAVVPYVKDIMSYGRTTFASARTY